MVWPFTLEYDSLANKDSILKKIVSLLNPPHVASLIHIMFSWALRWSTTATKPLLDQCRAIPHHPDIDPPEWSRLCSVAIPLGKILFTIYQSLKLLLPLFSAFKFPLSHCPFLGGTFLTRAICWVFFSSFYVPGQNHLRNTLVHDLSGKMTLENTTCLSQIRPPLVLQWCSEDRLMKLFIVFVDKIF